MPSTPASPEGVRLPATLANWRLAPQSRWAFRNVGRLIASDRIPAADREAVLRLPEDHQPVGALEFDAPDGRGRMTVDRMLDESDTDGFIVLKEGGIVFERYRGGLEPSSPHIVFSVSKSITGLVAGILAGRGLIDPDQPVTRYVPEVAASSAYRDATVRHVLDMTVSTDFEEAYLDPESDFARYRIATAWNPAPDPSTAPDLHGFLATMRKGSEPHGARLHYVSPNSDLLGWIVERAGGKPYAELVAALLWRPMGAEFDAYVTVDRKGSARSAGGVSITLRDAARIGETVRLGGRGVVPNAWIEDMLGGPGVPLVSDPEYSGKLPLGSYRSQWYRVGDGRGSFLAIGIHGQWIYVDPPSGVVIARLSSQALPVDDGLDRMVLAGYDAIARSLEA